MLFYKIFNPSNAGQDDNLIFIVQGAAEKVRQFKFRAEGVSR